MGRHSAPEQGHFYRSIVGWLLPWMMIAAVVVVAVWVAIDAVGRDDEALAPVARATPTERATPETSPTPTPSATPAATPTKKPRPAKKPASPELITEGISVQILNATSSPAADDRMAERLASLGFDVVSIEGANKEYARTTVFWSFPEARAAAEALAEKFGWASDAKPSNLSATVDLHVVVGSDEA